MINEEKLKRLIGHLEKLEALTGRKCRKTPREEKTDCPMGNFAPYYDRYHYTLGSFGPGKMSYYRPYCVDENYYDIYEKSDEYWWRSLTRETRIEYTNAIIKYFKERKNENPKT